MYQWFTDKEYAQLIANGKQTQIDNIGDHIPVVKLFTPDANCTWLLSEIVPDDNILAFGLCDLGLGCPELGYVSLTELEQLRGSLGLPVEKDTHFSATASITAYAKAARSQSRIIE